MTQKCRHCGRFMRKLENHPDPNLREAYGCDNCEILYKKDGYCPPVDNDEWFQLCAFKEKSHDSQSRQS